MRLIDDFFFIEAEQSAGEEHICRIRLNPAHTIYAVHFPGNPITPGVCIVQMATEIIERKTGGRLILSAANNIKFVKPITPQDTPVFVFSKPSCDGRQLRVMVKVTDGSEDIFAKLSLRYDKQ